MTGSKYENGAGAVYAAGEILLYSGDRLFAVAKAVSVPAENSGAAETETAVHKKGGETETKIRLMPNKFSILIKNILLSGGPMKDVRMRAWLRMNL